MDLAKSNPVQTIKEHTDDALALWNVFLKYYGQYFSEKEKKLIYWAVFYHDIGKINPGFQYAMHQLTGRKYDGIKPVAAEVPHGFLSGAYMDVHYLKNKFPEDFRLVITAVYNHHTRKDELKPAELKKYVADYLPETYRYDDDRILQRNKIYVRYVLSALGNRYDKSTSIAEEDWLKYIVIKGMLNKLDYAASGSKTSCIEIEPLPAGTLTESVKKIWPQLREVQQYMSAHKDENLVVVAATGSGKTEAALYWLDGSKCFYTLPLKVSINAIYERIKNEYEYDSAKITLLHSDLLAYYFLQQAQEQDTQKAVYDDPLARQAQARLLSYPLTICTVDQLFWFVFKAMGSELIPATLKYSKVIIDEIQMYSPDILACLIYGLKIITRLGGKFAIITATFPPVLGHFLNEQGIDVKLPENKFLGECQKRHKIALIEDDFDYEQIAAAGLVKKVLVLCNTVGKAQAVYGQLKEQGKVYLLHSRFTRKDRSILEKKIMAFSNEKGSVGIWISTQIVEASLDIDFDVLFTEMCPADNLLQRMGRCYRKRNYDAAEANVYIYNTKNGYGTVYEFKDIYDMSLEFLRQYNQQYFYEIDKLNYIDNVYAVERLKNSSYYKGIEERLDLLNKLPPATIESEKAREQFRNIQSITVLPDKFYEQEDVAQCIETLVHDKQKSQEERVKAKNELMQYTISIDKRLLFDKKKKRYLDGSPIPEVKWLDIHRCTCRYDFQDETGAGLCLEMEDSEERSF